MDPNGFGNFIDRRADGSFRILGVDPDAGRSPVAVALDRSLGLDDQLRAVAGPAVANLGLTTYGIGLPVGDPRIQPVVITGQSVAARAAAAQMHSAQGWANVYDEYGLFTLQGSAPIWNRVVAPVANAVSTAATFPQPFKSAVLSELEAKGQDAARRGDDRALMVLGIKHTFVDMMLPGSPQELAIGVGAGAVISKVLPAVTGVLNRVPVLGDTLPQLGNRISAAWAQGMENIAAPRTLNLQFGGLRIGSGGGAAEIGVPATRSANPLSPVLEYDGYGNEIYYRAMKESHYRTLVEEGVLKGTGETSLARLEAYSAGYDGALVRLTVKPGTSAELQNIGIAANQPAAAEFPGMSTRTGPWNQTNARFKVEATGIMTINDGLGIMNTQLGKGSALDIFNKNLLDFERLN